MREERPRYLKVALRNLRREKLYATPNVAGFALGIGACLILGLYLWDELTYDRHHVNHERIYRVAQYTSFGNDGERIEANFALTSTSLAPMLAEDESS